MLFCIVGTGRSGTTLLQRMLNSHPDLFIFPETHWLPKMYELFGEKAVHPERLADIVRRTHHVDGQPTTAFDKARLLTSIDGPVTVRGFTDALGGMLAADAGKRCWADKTPDYGYFIGTLQKLWANCKIIHLVRDGVAVASSMARHPGYQELARSEQLFWCPISLDFEPGLSQPRQSDPHQYVHLWHRRLQRTREEYGNLSAGSFREFKFESLTTEPNTVLREIAAFVGLNPDDEWINHAAAMIDPRKASKPRPLEWLEHFDDEATQMLFDLGYQAEQH